MASRTIRINGKKATVSVPDDSQQLLYVLREQLGQRGPKFGCGVAQCGSCTVLVDGDVTRSCVTKLSAVADGAHVTTLDGIATGRLHPMQRAFLDLQAGQCAFCVNGMIMGAIGWIGKRLAAGDATVPSEADVRAFLSGEAPGSTFVYLCRCGSHQRIVAAIRAGAQEMVK